MAPIQLLTREHAFRGSSRFNPKRRNPEDTFGNPERSTTTREIQ
jgi:hypothetical protein